MRSLSCIVAILALSLAPAGAEPKGDGGAKEFAPGQKAKAAGAGQKIRSRAKAEQTRSS